MKLLKIIFTIIATLIGAGFASGQEICTFFYIYGTNGLVGIVICCFFFAFVIYKVLVISITHNLENYKSFITLLTHNKGSKAINTIVNLFLLVTFFIMIAGFGSYFSQEIGISTYIGSGILSLLCFVTFMTRADGIIKISSFLVPILIFFILLIGYKNFTFIDLNSVLNMKPIKSNCVWLLSPLIYTSYNSILLIPGLVNFKKYLYTKHGALIVAIISSIILLLLSMSIFFILTKVDIDIIKLEMPVIYVISHYYKSFIQIYSFIILASIYTTAISIGISFLNNLSLHKNKYPLVVLIMCITAFIVSKIGFSNLVTNLYPLFGFLGLIQLTLLGIF
ncbi:MAG: hypothetical protein IKF17_00070 [Clostridia bacterium]|nr:hypothetical protein [Clostridia bacterium]